MRTFTVRGKLGEEKKEYKQIPSNGDLGICFS